MTGCKAEGAHSKENGRGKPTEGRKIMPFPIWGLGQFLVIAVGGRVEMSTQVSFKWDVQGLRAEIFAPGSRI